IFSGVTVQISRALPNVVPQSTSARPPVFVREPCQNSKCCHKWEIRGHPSLVSLLPWSEECGGAFCWCMDSCFIIFLFCCLCFGRRCFWRMLIALTTVALI
ncbi:unnamed protein product, partial [Ectocarpus sp. 4 AP-2014]